jgi:Predicted tRNA(5-methylaminomethyl-2-thiouridylate) methyltransferase, contains the PP-loop ATPase domain
VASWPARSTGWSIHRLLGDEIEVQIRHRARPVAGVIVRLADDELEIALPEGAAAITPGQSLVLYSGDVVLGGGVIERSRRELPVVSATAA